MSPHALQLNGPCCPLPHSRACHVAACLIAGQATSPPPSPLHMPYHCVPRSWTGHIAAPLTAALWRDTTAATAAWPPPPPPSHMTARHATRLSWRDMTAVAATAMLQPPRHDCHHHHQAMRPPTTAMPCSHHDTQCDHCHATWPAHDHHHATQPLHGSCHATRPLSRHATVA
jgi:hypothetical protein